MDAAFLLRDVVRRYVRDQRRNAGCGDGVATVRCHVLTELLHGGPLPQHQLVDRLMLDKGWISRAATALEEEGWVERRPSPHDRRSSLIALTAAGRAAAVRLDRGLDEHAAALLAAVAPAARTAFGAGLRQIHTALAGERTAPAPAPLWLRPALPADWPAIAALLAAAHLPSSATPPEGALFWVAQDEQAVRAAIGLQPAGAAGLVRSLVVAPERRGGGLGTALLTELEHQARTRGLRALYLLTTGAAPFFAVHGYAPVARDAIPETVRRLDQFQGVCPASAPAMGRTLQDTCS